MKIKKFTAPTLKDGKLKVIKELGEDAIILSSRTVSLADSGEEIVEIVAAIDDSPIRGNLTSTGVGIEEPTKQIDIRTLNQIYQEIDNLKDLIFDIREIVKYKYSGILGPVFGNIYKQLRKAEVSDELSLKISGNLLLKGNIKTIDDARRAARELLTRDIVIDDEIRDLKKLITQACIYGFVGPTGSGKTLSLMKLAITMKLLHQTDMVIISTDTYKTGGAEQLKTYSSIAGIPFSVAYSPEDLTNIINRELGNKVEVSHKSISGSQTQGEIETKDSKISESRGKFIFIDTTGRSGKNREGVNEIGTFLRSAGAIHIFLVLSANMGEAAFRESLEDFAILKPNSIILSKIDESPAIGGIVSTLQNFSIPLSYFTNGQRVPEDIEPASREKLGELILK